MLEDGVNFLLARQRADGLWSDFLTLAGEGVDWPAAFVAYQLTLTPCPRERLLKTLNSLITSQHPDGGWGYHRSVPTDADSTANVLLFFNAFGYRGDALKRAALHLARHQYKATGGVATYLKPGPIRDFMGLGSETDLTGWCSQHIEVTATAGLAFAAIGGAFRPKAAAAWNYVKRLQLSDGSWNSYWWNSPHFSTLQAAMLAQKFGVETAVRRAAAWAVHQQDTDGGWKVPGVTSSSPFATALSLSLLLLAGQKGREVERALELLADLQDEDGGWPNSPVLRIPSPHLANPDTRLTWRVGGLGTGVVVPDQNRIFTTAACVAALACAKKFQK